MTNPDNKPHKIVEVFAPMDAEIIDINQCDDPVYADQIIGRGVLAIPKTGKVYAPVTGRVEMLTETGHAIGILTESGIEVFVHIGLDTVELSGEAFSIHTNKDAWVSKGDLLVEFDIEMIEDLGKSIQTPIIITNPEKREIVVFTQQDTSIDDKIMEIR